MPLVEPNISAADFSLDIIGPMLRRSWPVVLLVFLGSIFGIYGGLMYMTEQYEAEARLLVKLGRENAQAPVSVDKGAVYTTGVQKEEINSYVQLLSSRNLIMAAVDTLGEDRFRFDPPKPETLLQAIKYYVKLTIRTAKSALTSVLVTLNLKKELSPRQLAVEMLVRAISVELERDSNVILVKVRLPDGLLAMETVDTLIHIYLRRHVDLRRDLDVGEVFAAETSADREKLEALQKTMRELKSRWNLAAVDQQRSGLVGRLESLEQERHLKSSELAKLKIEQQITEQQLKEMPATRVASKVVETNPALTQIREHLVNLRVKRANMLNLYKEDSSTLALVDQEISELDSLQATQEKTTTRDTIYVPFEGRDVSERGLRDTARVMAGLTVEITQVEQARTEARAELERLNEGDSMLTLMQLDWDVLQQKFLTNSARREEARTSEALSSRGIANIAIMSESTVGAEPVTPRKILIMSIGSVASLLLGIGVALLREWGRDIIYSARDLANLPEVRLLGEYRLG